MSSKSIYSSLYDSICEDRKSKIDQCKPGRGLHKHHIVPRHHGGGEDESNFTYLTVREHIIAHFLLWKIYGQINDLRAMHMLGANLSVEKRRQIGKWCYENKIGWHKYTKEEKSEIGKRQRDDRKINGTENEWDFWASKEGQLLRASMGGKKGGKTTAERRNGGWNCAENHSYYASLGGKAAPKYPVFDTESGVVRKLYTESEREQFLKENPQFISGFGDKTSDPSKKKKFPCKNILTGEVIRFVTKDERSEFVKNNPHWVNGREKVKSKPFSIYNIDTLEKISFENKNEALQFINENPNWKYGRHKVNRKRYYAIDTITNIRHGFDTYDELQNFLLENPAHIESKTKKYPAYNIVSREIVCFYTREERDVYVMEFSGWLSGYGPTKKWRGGEF